MPDSRHILGILSGLCGLWTTTRLQWQLRCSSDIVFWFGGWFVVGFRPTAVVRDPRSPLLFPPDTLSVPIGHADHPAAPWAAGPAARTAARRPRSFSHFFCIFGRFSGSNSTVQRTSEIKSESRICPQMHGGRPYSSWNAGSLILAWLDLRRPFIRWCARRTICTA